ncbi:hypothetical protein AC578_4503 [Pseudocercospora eumusae]|uniref:F-box domain-containing protein n=1 Tax=Pseudocercospora eumusae TaxID=321146 RepID=A0A139GWE7_9PEZI|nr:hypothetical protein AC578_4503 [Pseudocercospora eumusae]
MSSVERVQQTTTMAATALPLELLQQIFSFLDPKSFYWARKTCRYWNFASTDAVPLARQLRKLPILPPVHASECDPAEIESVFGQAARNLLLGVKVDRAHDKPGTLSKASKLGFPCHPRVQATTNGDMTVTLSGRTIALFDTSGSRPRVLAQRTLNDLKETVGSGPWLKVQPNSYHELALSSDARLLAVAQERTIQVYDLLAEPDSFTVNNYISSATGHYICGLDFEQDDHVLRVRLSGKGAVLYLGTPPVGKSRGDKATIDHWKSGGGLKHTFLDSSLLQLPCGPGGELDQTARISGVQLLRPFDGGWLVGMQKHGGGESSYYALGHVETTRPGVPGSVTELSRLESFLSSWNFTINAASNDHGLGLWENMPSAHEHHPRYALSEKGGFLALAERDKKRIRPCPLTQLFVYRLPSESELRKNLLGQRAAGKSGNDGLATAQSPGDAEAANMPRSCKFTVPRIPLCLTTIIGDVTALSFSSADEATCALSAATQDSTRTWLLQDL